MVVAPVEARGQSSDEAALFLLLPVGARSVGLGNSMVSQSGTSDVLWWNPAGIASVHRADASLHHSQSLIGTDDALSVAFTGRPLGVFAVSANVLDFGGEIPALDNEGNVVGRILPRNIALVATYAATVGRSLRLGASYKYLQFRFDCDQLCPLLAARKSATDALDFGLQYQGRLHLPVTVGLAIRNVPAEFRREHGENGSALPTRIQVGALAQYDIPHELADDAQVSVAVDLFDQLPVRSPRPRVGAEFAWEHLVFLRGGYVFESTDTESGSPSLGLGFVVGRLVIDFARVFSGLSADAGQAPTYLSLRLGF
jgi:hypothetical protein